MITFIISWLYDGIWHAHRIRINPHVPLEAIAQEARELPLLPGRVAGLRASRDDANVYGAVGLKGDGLWHLSLTSVSDTWRSTHSNATDALYYAMVNCVEMLR